MNILGKVLLITALAGVGGTGAGGLAACLLRRESDQAVSLLLSFAAGVMTAVVCFDLLRDAIEPENAPGQSYLFVVMAGVLVGYAVIGALNALVDRSSAAGHRRRNRNSLLTAGVVMAAAIALHNMPEGMVIGASFAKSDGTELLNRSGFVMAAVIGLHNVPEGMAVAVPMISGGMGRGRAVGITAVTGAPTILGALLGYSLGVMGPMALAMSLSFASGAMLYVVFGELLPEAFALWKSRLPALSAIIGMMVGMMIVYW